MAITMPATDAETSASRRRYRRPTSRRRRSSKPMPSMPASSLRCAVALRSLPGRTSAAIGSLRCSVSSPSAPSTRISAGGKHSRSACVGICRRARLARDDQAEDAVRAPEALEGEDLLVDPARLRGLRRADDDLAGRLLERRGQRRAEVGGGRELVAVAEHGREPRRHGPECRSPCPPGASAAGRSRGRGAASAPISRRCGCS